MSDYKPVLYINFINRRTGSEISSLPLVNRISLNIDIRQLCAAFDFDIEFRLSEKVDLKSHDFVEFYFIINNTRFQVACGFVEDFVKETGSNLLKFQANGRDFLGQLFNLPFLNAKPIDQTTIAKFAEICIKDGYLPEYLSLKGITRSIVDKGAYSGTVLVPELSDAKRGPVLQQTADEVYNCIYQNRFGQVVVWGRSYLNDLDTGLVITDTKDSNVGRFVLRENYSKVFSEVKIFYTGGEQNVDYKSTPSQPIFNSEKKARQIFQPEIRTFQTATLVNTAGQVNIQDKKNQLAASILRKSNQNLYQVVISTNKPFFETVDGTKVPYEVNQLWTIKSEVHSLNEKMKLVGIGYTQSDSSLDVQLCFIPKDSLV